MDMREKTALAGQGALERPTRKKKIVSLVLMTFLISLDLPDVQKKIIQEQQDKSSDIFM